MYPDEIITIQREKMVGSRKISSFNNTDGYKIFIWVGFFIFKIVIIFCQAKFAVDHINDFSLFSGAAATFFIPVLGVSKLYSRLRHDKKIREMFAIIDNEFWDTGIVKKELSDALSSRITLISNATSLHVLTSLGVCFILAIFPLAKYPDGTKKLPSVVWFPFNTNPTPIYQIVFFVLAFTNHVTVLNHTCSDHIYIYFSQHVSVQFCLLKELLRNITEVPSIPDEKKYDSEEYQKILAKRMQTCVAHHIRLITFLKDFRDIFSFTLGVQVALSILSLVFIGYILEAGNNDFTKTMKLLIYVTVVSVQATLYAVHGSELEYQYGTVAQAIYDSEWYFGNKGFRTGVQLILMTSQIPVPVTAMGLTEVNNTSIIMIYRTVFSILTLIQEMVG